MYAFSVVKYAKILSYDFCKKKEMSLTLMLCF